MSKPGAPPPAGQPLQRDELTLESTHTLKARVSVPSRPQPPAVAQPAPVKPAATTGGLPAAKPASRTGSLHELYTLESTMTAKARVMPQSDADPIAAEVKAAAAAAVAPPPEPPRRVRLSTNELHALSLKIKAEREQAGQQQARGGAAPPQSLPKK